MRFLRNHAAWVIVASSLVIIVVGVFLVATVRPAHPAEVKGRPPQTSAVTPVSVTQPPSAKEVAATLGCTSFKDLGSAPDVGVVDSGSCWIGNTKYAINTFVNSAVRDNWLSAAEQLGVVPKWETDTSVTYKSVD